MYKIEIKTKEQFNNGNCAALLEDIKGLSISQIKKADCCPLYCIEGSLSLDEAKKIAREILADKITQEFIVLNDKPQEIPKNDAKKSGNLKKTFASIEVYYRKGVTDTASASVIKAVKDLGISADITVKTGQKYYFWGDFSLEILEKIAKKLLSNNLIQEYKLN